jgi:maltooligosyltrehalose trehalohydrolase
MTRIAVWSPSASRVELLTSTSRYPMAAQEQGWWSVEDEALVPGTDYSFRLDGEGPFPDPRSEWQPHGVNGPSRLLDHADFHWTDGSWQPPLLTDAVVYELHVGTFSPEGTFDGVVGKLDQLVELGVTHLELMPVHEFPGERGWGYDSVDLYAPHHSYGGPDGLKRLVDACHRRGLAVLLDVVYNHFGPYGNHLPRFGPYSTEQYQTPWGGAVNLDGPGSDQVRRFICNNTLNWLRNYHFDGIRLDAVHALVDLSARHLLEQLADEVSQLATELGRPLLLIAESNQNDPSIVRSSALGGYGLDALWNDDFHHALHVTLTGEQTDYYRDFTGIVDLVRALQRGLVYEGRYAPSRDHSYGRPSDGLTTDKFVVYSQNHDQVGNRALGERTAELLTPAGLLIGAALVLMSPFVPMLFQGQEWGADSPFLYFTDHRDPELARSINAGRRREFPELAGSAENLPDPQALATFERSRLNWEERDQPAHARLLDWHRRLIRLRRSSPELAAGDWGSVTSDPAAGWLELTRGRFHIVVNLGQEPRSIPISGGTGGRLEARLCSDSSIQVGPDSAQLPPGSVVILERVAD